MNQPESGLYQELVTENLTAALASLDSDKLRAELADLDPAESAQVLAGHVERMLRTVLTRFPREDRIEQQIQLCNQVLALVAAGDSLEDLTGGKVSIPGEILLSLLPPSSTMPARPQTALDASALLINAPREPKLARELAAEIDSADRVELLCSFVMWNGVRAVREALEGLSARSGRLRVITTTYMGTTERRALDLLEHLGAEIKVSYDHRITRLHAKAWLFERRSGFSTAYIGSSNLSHAALHEGLEWNVRISQRSAPDLMQRFRTAFSTYWEDQHFLPYDAEKFDEVIDRERHEDTIDLAPFDVRPYPHQEAILEQLQVERERHHRFKNLVVAATGTGKTVVAALDYRRLAEEWGGAKLLFVAHRQEILKQSMTTFRHVMRDGSFGELYVAGRKPDRWQHVFASVQSLSGKAIDGLAPDAFDMVIIDEFHHAAAPTYERVLNRLEPRVLLGLTATPERADGKDITTWFEGRIAAELRLWQAIDEGLLCPFQYFGIADGTDLSDLEWRKGGYRPEVLSHLLTGDDARVAKILQSVRDQVLDVSEMRALGFCVSIEHANYMANSFTKAGIVAQAVSGNTPQKDRDEVLRRLKNRKVNVLFAVDLYNEGVDVPEIDTVLFLRPTESATVFLQQLGRGLRRSQGKSGLTVLDFIGQQHRNFRFDLRFRALTGTSRRELERQVAEGFPFLPSGCHISLDRVSSQTILENLRSTLGLRKDQLVAELKTLGDISLSDFLGHTGVELEDIYRGARTWTQLKREASLSAPKRGPDEDRLAKGIGRILHIDDPERLALYREVLSDASNVDDLDERQKRLLTMLHYDLWITKSFGSLEEAYDELKKNPAIVAELLETLEIMDQRADTLPMPAGLDPSIPLHVHERYARDEVLAAVGQTTIEKATQLREGVRWVDGHQLDLLFVTLNKSEKHYSPSTMYADHAISPTLFHWESQSTTSDTSATGKRYINHQERGSSVLLFLRQDRSSAAGRAEPYLFAGPVTYVSHEGSRPMAITWKLAKPLPTAIFEVAKAVN